MHIWGTGVVENSDSVAVEQPQSFITALHRDLVSVAQWNLAAGNGAGHPMAGVGSVKAPPSVRSAMQRLSLISYADLVRATPQPRSPSPDSAGTLPLYMRMLTERSTIILLERILPDRPTTLRALGRRMGVSYQRVAQLEHELRDWIDELTAPGTPLREVVDTFLAQVGPLCPLETVIAQTPHVADLVPGSDIPVWRLIDRVIDGVEVRDGWLATPSLETVVRASRFVLRELEVRPGVADTVGHRGLWGFTDDQRSRWAELCGYVAFHDVWVAPAPNVADALEQALAVASGPQSPEELMESLRALGHGRSNRTIATALRQDRRFAQAPDGRWRLVDDAATFATAIRAVRRLLTERGAIPLGELLDLADELQVCRADLEFHTRAGQFEVVDGMVRLRLTPQPTVFPPQDAPSMVCLPEGWAQLVSLTAPMLESHLMSLSAAVPPLYGLDHPGRRTFASPAGGTIAWENSHVTLALPTSALAGRRVGDRVLIVFGADCIEVRPAAPVDASLSGWAAALNSLGLSGSGDPRRDRRAFAAALGLAGETCLIALATACRRKRAWAALAAICPG